MPTYALACLKFEPTAAAPPPPHRRPRTAELHISPESGAPQYMFVNALYSVETSDAERIGVDQVARIMPSGKASGAEQRESLSGTTPRV